MTSTFLALVSEYMWHGSVVGNCGKVLMLDQRWPILFVCSEFVISIHFLQVEMLYE